MGKQEEVKKLAWKYFWEQKTKELLDITLGVVGGMVIPLIVGFFALKGQPMISDSILLNLLFIWVLGTAVLLGLIIICLLIYITIIEWFIGWIKSNWVEASARAKNEINKKSKGGKQK